MNTPAPVISRMRALTSIHYIAMNEAAPSLPRARSQINLSEKDIARFWAKVDKNGPIQPHMETQCWIWSGGMNRLGYGKLRVHDKYILTHRIAWTLANGPIPQGTGYHGTCALHRCDNPACCRADHIFLGTHAENMADREAKGRNNPQYGDRNGSRLHPESVPRGDNHYARTQPERLARGDEHGCAKLTTDKVIEIRARHAAGGISHRRLAAQFGMSRPAISEIIRRKTWRHIP